MWYKKPVLCIKLSSIYIFADISTHLWKQATPINISKTEVLLKVLPRAMISTVEYFQETVKGVYVIWQGEKQKGLFLSPERPVGITTVKKKADYWLISFPPAIFLSLDTAFDSLKNRKSPQRLWVLGLEKERLFLFSLKPVVGRVTKSSVCCFGTYITLVTATDLLCSFWCKGEHQKILGIWSWVQHSIKHTF